MNGQGQTRQEGDPNSKHSSELVSSGIGRKSGKPIRSPSIGVLRVQSRREERKGVAWSVHRYQTNVQIAGDKQMRYLTTRDETDIQIKTVCRSVTRLDLTAADRQLARAYWPVIKTV